MSPPARLKVSRSGLHPDCLALTLLNEVVDKLA